MLTRGAASDFHNDDVSHWRHHHHVGPLSLLRGHSPRRNALRILAFAPEVVVFFLSYLTWPHDYARRSQETVRLLP